MNVFVVVCNWVDRSWTAGYWRGLPLPGIIPFFPALWLGNAALDYIAWAWFFLWSAFIFWRWAIFMRREAMKADEKYDRIGKYKLSKEYWSTHSSTAAARRKKKNG